jgi:SAM-dependent methyltransferase
MSSKTASPAARGRRATAARKRATRPQAELADRHDLYERAVQSPELDVGFFDETFRRLRGRRPLVLREDFCGTANLCAAWCRSSPKRRAIGVDLDREVLAWGRARHLDPAPAVAARVRLVQGDVRRPVREPADITCALNFSYCVFKSRDELRGYFRAARRDLAPDGLFMCELYGGTEAIIEIEDVDEKDGFTYHWEQAAYDPISHDTLCHIHFSFPDGSRIERAFTYDWRLWTIPEVRELLAEAGFARTRVFWEKMIEEHGEEDLVGTGEYEEIERVENQEAWLVYVVAEKRTGYTDSR